MLQFKPLWGINSVESAQHLQAAPAHLIVEEGILPSAILAALVPQRGKSSGGSGQHLHAASAHLVVEEEAVANARGARAVVHGRLQEQLVGGDPIQLHLVHDVSDEVRPGALAAAGLVVKRELEGGILQSPQRIFFRTGLFCPYSPTVSRRHGEISNQLPQKSQEAS